MSTSKLTCTLLVALMALLALSQASLADRRQTHYVYISRPVPVYQPVLYRPMRPQPHVGYARAPVAYRRVTVASTPAPLVNGTASSSNSSALAAGAPADARANLSGFSNATTLHATSEEPSVTVSAATAPSVSTSAAVTNQPVSEPASEPSSEMFSSSTSAPPS